MQGAGCGVQGAGCRVETAGEALQERAQREPRHLWNNSIKLMGGASYRGASLIRNSAPPGAYIRTLQAPWTRHLLQGACNDQISGSKGRAMYQIFVNKVRTMHLGCGEGVIGGHVRRAFRHCSHLSCTLHAPFCTLQAPFLYITSTFWHITSTFCTLQAP